MRLVNNLSWGVEGEKQMDEDLFWGEERSLYSTLSTHLNLKFVEPSLYNRHFSYFTYVEINEGQLNGNKQRLFIQSLL